MIKVNRFWFFKSFFLSCWNQFCHNDLDSDDKFGSKKLTKRWFDDAIKRNLALDQLYCRSLACMSNPKFLKEFPRPLNKMLVPWRTILRNQSSSFVLAGPGYSENFRHLLHYFETSVVRAASPQPNNLDLKTISSLLFWSWIYIFPLLRMKVYIF